MHQSYSPRCKGTSFTPPVDCHSEVEKQPIQNHREYVKMQPTNLQECPWFWRTRTCGRQKRWPSWLQRERAACQYTAGGQLRTPSPWSGSGFCPCPPQIWNRRRTERGGKVWWRWWSRASCPRMSVDILGTSCDRCRITVQCCFTSTETVRLIRTESPGRPPRLSHNSWTLMTMTSSSSSGDA